MPTLHNFFAKSRYTIMYGLSLALLVFLLKWLHWKFLILDHAMDLYMGLIALFFTLLGIWIASQLSRTKSRTIIVEKEIIVHRPENFIQNTTALEELGLTSREFEVLQLLCQGMSNAEIAETLSLSLSTIKTHASKLFIKMDVKSRTQAVGMAKRLRLVP